MLLPNQDDCQMVHNMLISWRTGLKLSVCVCVCVYIYIHTNRQKLNNNKKEKEEGGENYVGEESYNLYL